MLGAAKGGKPLFVPLGKGAVKSQSVLPQGLPLGWSSERRSWSPCPRPGKLEDLKAKIVQKNLGHNWNDPLGVGTWAQSQGLKPIAGIGRRTVRKNRSGKESDHIIRNPDFFFCVPPFSEGWLVLLGC